MTTDDASAFIDAADWHVYQILTKRSSLLQKFINDRYRSSKAPAHLWFGVSVENERATSRSAHLQKANASIRFLSVNRLSLLSASCVLTALIG